MRETPPDRIVEMRLRLAQYLDGALTPDEVAALTLLLEQSPLYQSELASLQKSRAAVREALEKESESPQHASEVPLDNEQPALWQEISKHLKSDQNATLQTVDSEFISAYYDGEIPDSDPVLAQFEAQLFQNDAANQLLADFGEVSEAVRQFGYRMETACSLDITQQVMAAFQAETITDTANQATTTKEAELQALGGLPPEGLTTEQTEILSAYVDQALSPKETIEANRLIEQEQSAKNLVSRYNWLSENIQSVSEQLQAQAPDVWPAIQQSLAETPLSKETETGAQLLPFAPPKTIRSAFRIALPVAAAAFLAVLSLPALQGNSNGIYAPNEASLDGRTYRGSAASLAAQSKNVRYQGDGASFDGQQLASLPMGATSRQVLFRAPASANDVSLTSDDGMSRRSPTRVRIGDTPGRVVLRPILEKPGRQLASQHHSSTMTDATDFPRGKTPSSDEYLFNALNEQGAGEDVSSMLGN